MKKFTLIELLIVVAIIGILVSILMPSLNNARKKAQTAVCLSNSKQVHLSWQLFLRENKSIGFDYVTNHSQREIWTGNLVNFMNEPDLLICPATKRPDDQSSGYVHGNAKGAWAERRWGTRDPWDESSYGYNIALCPKNMYSNQYPTYQSIDAVFTPAETPVTGDSWWRAPAQMGNNLTRYIPANLDDPRTGFSGNTLNKFLTNRHGKVTVLSFVDGHASTVSLAGLYGQMWFDGYDQDKAVIDLSQ